MVGLLMLSDGPLPDESFRRCRNVEKRKQHRRTHRLKMKDWSFVNFEKKSLKIVKSQKIKSFRETLLIVVVE